MSWDIQFYETKNGKCPVEMFINSIKSNKIPEKIKYKALKYKEDYERRYSL